jgi:hypothetical protein
METTGHLVLEPGDISVPFRQQAQHSSVIVSTNQRQPGVAQSGDRHRPGIIRISFL